MSNQAKRRSHQHLIDDQGVALLKRLLPEHWVVREYRPDYGLDFAVEVFQVPSDAKASSETLGEHFFIQLKSTKSPTVGAYKIYGRGNVEKAKEALTDQLVGEINTYRFSLDVAELVTVERMGIAVPVLLVVADLTTERCSFVCLNDYVDKILIPAHDDYRASETRTIHVPADNGIGTDVGTIALRWYAKRAKLIAAFQRFTFQYAELQYARPDEFRALAEYFAQRISQYDFWDDVEMCEIIGHYRDGLRRFLDSGQPHLLERSIPLVDVKTFEGEMDDHQKRMDVLMLWRGLSVLPRNYEDVWREWFLPTALGHLTSSPHA